MFSSVVLGVGKHHRDDAFARMVCSTSEEGVIFEPNVSRDAPLQQDTEAIFIATKAEALFLRDSAYVGTWAAARTQAWENLKKRVSKRTLRENSEFSSAGFANIRKHTMFRDSTLRDVEDTMSPDEAVLATHYGFSLEAILYKTDLADIQACVRDSNIPMQIYNDCKRVGMQPVEYNAWVKENGLCPVTAKVIRPEVNFLI